MYQQSLEGLKKPTAHIAVNRNRLKQYGDTIYLKDNTHFEIELFNPKTIKVLAKIHLNGVLISQGGIVLLPGQRFFLDRWLDEPRKFIFETYDVEDSASAKAAISENGKIRVEFYDEVLTDRNLLVNILKVNSDWTHGFQPSFNSDRVTNCCTYLISGQNNSLTDSTFRLNSIETGRAEKGDRSEQRFSYDSSAYSFNSTATYDIRILPESQKPVEVANIRNYCHSCGARIKNSSWKFCPQCGTKF